MNLRDVQEALKHSYTSTSEELGICVPEYEMLSVLGGVSLSSHLRPKNLARLIIKAPLPMALPIWAHL